MCEEWYAKWSALYLEFIKESIKLCVEYGYPDTSYYPVVIPSELSDFRCSQSGSKEDFVRLCKPYAEKVKMELKKELGLKKVKIPRYSCEENEQDFSFSFVLYLYW